MKKRAFIIHGFHGHAEGSWRPWLKNELEKRGWLAFTPQMPHADYPVPGEWLAALKDAVGTPDANCFFVGHSLGCVTILHYLQSLLPQKRVGGALFVAGPTDYRRVVDIKPFFSQPFDWKRIKSACPRSIALYSDDDPLVPLSSGELLKKELGAKLIVAHAMGHFTGDEGHLTLPVALDALLSLADAPT